MIASFHRFGPAILLHRPGALISSPTRKRESETLIALLRRIVNNLDPAVEGG
jgi:hypothetical protein